MSMIERALLWWQSDFEARVQREVERRLAAMAAEPTAPPTTAETKLSKEGVWPEETYRKILACLHPDRSVSDAWLNEAFNAFVEAKLLLVKPKEPPRPVRRGLRRRSGPQQ